MRARLTDASSLVDSDSFTKETYNFKIKVSFVKEPYKRDDNLQKRPIILRSLLILATPYLRSKPYLGILYRNFAFSITPSHSISQTHRLRSRYLHSTSHFCILYRSFAFSTTLSHFTLTDLAVYICILHHTFTFDITLWNSVSQLRILHHTVAFYITDLAVYFCILHPTFTFDITDTFSRSTAYCIWSVISSFSNLNRSFSSLGLFYHVWLKRDPRRLRLESEIQ